MMFQRIGGVFLLIGLAAFAAWNYFPPQPVLVVWVSLVASVLGIVLLLVSLFARRAGNKRL